MILRKNKFIQRIAIKFTLKLFFVVFVTYLHALFQGHPQMVMVNAQQGQQQPMQPGQLVHQQAMGTPQMIVTGPGGQQQLTPQQVYNPYGGQVMMMNPQASTASGQVQPGQPMQMVIMPQQQQGMFF